MTFDPHDYFDIRNGKAVCPVHGERDRNLGIKRSKQDDKWSFTCYSHACTLVEIADAAGFRPQDIYDDNTSVEYQVNGWLPPSGPVTRETVAERVKTQLGKPTIEERFRDEWGFNPCKAMSAAWTDADGSGGVSFLPCRKIGCDNCGPRLRWLRHEFTVQELGAEAYIGTYGADAVPKMAGGYVRIPHGEGLVTVITDTAVAGAVLAEVDAGWFDLHASDGRIFSMGGGIRARWKELSAYLSLSTKPRVESTETVTERQWWVALQPVDLAVLLHTLEADGCVVQRHERGDQVVLEWTGDGAPALASVGFLEVELLSLNRLMPDGFEPADVLPVPF